MKPTGRTSKSLPYGYRYKQVCIDQGTGYGDERYALGLQKFETRERRVGIWPFRRTIIEEGWWTVETFGQGSPSLFEYRQAAESAWTRYHNETGGVHA